MALIVVIPILALMGWVIHSTWKVNSSFFKAAHTRRLMGAVIAGVALGLFFAIAASYSLNQNMIIHGFPVPFQIVRIENTEHLTNHFPPLLAWTARLTNFVAGIGLAHLPFKIWLDLKKFKAETPQ
jgi:hypothetical protein